ncbi:hypothetical protein [Nocardiopsis sp. L17-MgMaSL7]|uniref:hypothetical protein n=1 Tax=Nocardiopsis sp. L17-MgMaSL7 TaxID=1938893 RepID=UPI000D911887|nr:hypothetical protein [Nocardiopsis sp. L17-MgMaSL7]PWV54843.1 hypothetical protein BDW27_104306 [Nocardiopsis sp. L17-MgMaSL7]
MTLGQLRKLAQRRPVVHLDKPKAELITELRELDRRRAEGEPEEVPHPLWRMQKLAESFERETQEKERGAASQRVEELLQPWNTPEYRRGVHAALSALHEKSEPSEEEWKNYFATLHTLVGPLLEGGWALWEDDQEGYHEPGDGPRIMARLLRTGVCLLVTYDVWASQIEFSSNEFVDDVEDPPYGCVEPLDDPVTVDLQEGVEHAQREVEARLGALGLLDPLRLKAAEGSDVNTTELVSCAYSDWVFAPAASYSGLSTRELAARLDTEEGMSSYYGFVCRFAGGDVLPDYVPGAAALGIATWCWRNDTAVEAWHLPDDVLMARVNIAVTKAVLPHLDAIEGTDWEAIETQLTDPEWALPDGRKISELFGEGWPEVRRTVSEQLRFWRRMDEEHLGPEPTLRLLSVGGATSYTRSWWGQGRWSAICGRIVQDAIKEGFALPAAYREAGPKALLRDLTEPDTLDDDTLLWLIDMPDAGTNQPGGLRHHSEATRPVLREFTIELLAEDRATGT